MIMNQQLEYKRHTLAHLLTAAVVEQYPHAKLTLGPAIDTGFYYDIDFSAGTAPGEDDLKSIQKGMKKQINKWTQWSHEEVSADVARERFAGNQFKLELIDEIEAGNIQAVVVYRLDRLTRSIADFYELWRIFEKHDVVFVSATEAFSTDTPTGELFLNLLLSLAQWERQLTRQRVCDKIAERSKRGYWNGGNPPFGYDYSRE
jgi:DNA invertase Pin-like site-specific DNA recombinase